MTKTHPEIRKIKQYYNDFLFSVSSKKDTIILPDSVLEKQFGERAQSNVQTMCSFFENEILDQMKTLIKSIDLLPNSKSDEEKYVECDNSLKEAVKAYGIEFGWDYKILKEIFEANYTYQRLDLWNLRANLELLGIKETDSHLVWIARMYEFLPLHKDWISYYDNVKGMYCYRHKLSLSGTNIRPCFYYIEELISITQLQIAESKTKDALKEYNHSFRDKLGREIKIANNTIFDYQKESQSIDEKDGPNAEKDKLVSKMQKITRNPFMSKYEKYY